MSNGYVEAAPDAAARRACVVLGAISLGLGLWAFLFPASFFEVIAPYDPYNRHLLHDAGALQVGIGIVLLAAATRRGAAVAALSGYAGFQALHIVSHWIDRDLGGSLGRDLTFLSILLLVAGWALIRSVRSSRASGRPDRTVG